MTDIKINFDNTLTTSQLLRNEATTIALAKMLLSKEKFDEFLNEIDKQYVYSLKDYVQNYPDTISDKEDLEKRINERIDSFKLGS